MAHRHQVIRRGQAPPPLGRVCPIFFQMRWPLKYVVTPFIQRAMPEPHGQRSRCGLGSCKSAQFLRTLAMTVFERILVLPYFATWPLLQGNRVGRTDQVVCRDLMHLQLSSLAGR